MRKVLKFYKARHNRFFWYNLYYQLWYSFHYVFFSSLIFDGRKLFAFNLMLRIKNALKMREHDDPFLVFLISMLKIAPNIILLPIKKSGVVQGVAFPISDRKKVTFTVKWVIKVLKDLNRVVKVSTIVDLLVSAIYNRGISFGKKRDVYLRSMRTRHLIKFFK